MHISDWSSDVCSSYLQLYRARDRAAMREVLAIVREAKARAFVLTVDLIPDGRTAPPPPPPAFWEIPAPEASFNGLYSGASIDDLAWLCAEAALPVIVKGVLRGDDARSCVDAGASGLIVSNPGGTIGRASCRGRVFHDV